MIGGVRAYLMREIPSLTEAKASRVAKRLKFNRIDPGSVINHRTEWYRKRGYLKRENEDWTDDECHLLGELYVVQKKSRHDMIMALGRSDDALLTKIATMTAHRLKRSGRVYVQHKDWKPSRKGKHYGYRDNHLLFLSTRKFSIENGGYMPEYISLILRRDVDDVRARMRSLAKPIEGLLDCVNREQKADVDAMSDKECGIRINLILKRTHKGGVSGMFQLDWDV